MNSEDDFDACMALADERMNADDYPAARDAYRRVAMMRPPSEATLHNLRVAEENTRLMRGGSAPELSELRSGINDLAETAAGS